MNDKRQQLMHEVVANIALTGFLFLAAIIGSFAYMYHTSAGLYSHTLDVMFVKGGENVNAMQEVALHEIGHWYYYQALNTSQRDTWRALSHDSATGDFASFYGKKNAAEDFAETYRVGAFCINQHDAVAHVSVNKSQYFKEHVHPVTRPRTLGKI